MFRSSLHHVRFVASPVTAQLGAPTRRFLSTSSNATKKSTWKGIALRWGTAGAAVYIYNTSPIFQDVPMPQAVTPPKHFDEADNLTIDAIIESRRKQIQEDKAAKAATQKVEAVAQVPMSSEATQTAVTDGSPEGQTSGAESQGAYNPETGEINWDCPCLGGMAYGPCGEEFKAAFSCFVYSEAEPKGMDCIEKFQGMQNCFREYPDVYAAELDEDDAPPATSAEDAAKPAQLEAALAQGENEETSKVIEDKKDEVKKADKSKKEFKTKQIKQDIKEVAREVKETVKSEVSVKAEEIKEAKPKKAVKAAKIEEKTEKVENTKTA